MNELISVELLNEVLEIDCEKVYNVICVDYPKKNKISSDIEFKYVGHEASETINIYELAHKCKVWAFNLPDNKEQNISIDFIASGLIKNIAPELIKNVECKGYCRINYYSPQAESSGSELFNAETEPEAIFKACEWIREQL